MQLYVIIHLLPIQVVDPPLYILQTHEVLEISVGVSY